MYITSKRQAVGEYICFYFGTGGSKRCFHWGSAQCFPKTIAHGPMNMALLEKRKEKESYEHTHELNNMNHTITPNKYLAKNDFVIKKLDK